jgi:hypothetical protein
MKGVSGMVREVVCEVCGTFTADRVAVLAYHWRSKHGVSPNMALADAKKLFSDVGSKTERIRNAAPQLLAACEAVINSDMAQREEDEGRTSAILSVVRAAIAQAKGESA